MFIIFFLTLSNLLIHSFGAKVWCNKSNITQGFWSVRKAILWQKVLGILPHFPSILDELVTKLVKTPKRLEDSGSTVGGGEGAGFFP